MSEQIISTGMIPPIRINDQLIPISEYALEKAIFRSSILGMVDNWTRDWRTKTFCVNTNKYSKTSIIQSLTNYIHKYDQEYDVGKELDRCPGEFIEKVLRVLLEWVYNNFAYNRRQSLKTIYQYCKDFKNSDDFKLKIENIFRITETTFTLDHIVESPRDYGKWFDLFYEIKEGYRHRFHDKQEVIRIQGTLIRYLESFRNNTGLNVISGLVRLLLDDYLDTDGRPRFELGLSQIAEYDLADRIKILNELLAFSGILRDMGKEYLGEALCNAFPGNEETIYRSLGDSTSANLIIGATTAKLSTIIKRYHGTV
jgi:ATP-dependent DNA helicase RecQ